MKKPSAESLSIAVTYTSAVLRNLKSRFLEGLTPDEIQSVLEAAKPHRFPARSVITNQEDAARHLFLLLSGRARYFFVTEKGQKVILLWIPPGEIFGSAALLSELTPYHISVETVSDSSTLVWDRPAIRSFTARCPRLVENALSLTVKYLTAYRAAHVALLCSSAEERLAEVLLSLARGIGQHAEGGIELKVRNEELANEANITPFTTSRLLTRWQRIGILRKSRGAILLRSPELLLRQKT